MAMVCRKGRMEGANCGDGTACHRVSPMAAHPCPRAGGHAFGGPVSRHVCNPSPVQTQPPPPPPPRDMSSRHRVPVSWHACGPGHRVSATPRPGTSRGSEAPHPQSTANPRPPRELVPVPARPFVPTQNRPRVPVVPLQTQTPTQSSLGVPAPPPSPGSRGSGRRSSRCAWCCTHAAPARSGHPPRVERGNRGGCGPVAAGPGRGGHATGPAQRSRLPIRLRCARHGKRRCGGGRPRSGSYGRRGPGNNAPSAPGYGSRCPAWPRPGRSGGRGGRNAAGPVPGAGHAPVRRRRRRRSDGRSRCRSAGRRRRCPPPVPAATGKAAGRPCCRGGRVRGCPQPLMNRPLRPQEKREPGGGWLAQGTPGSWPGLVQPGRWGKEGLRGQGGGVRKGYGGRGSLMGPRVWGRGGRGSAAGCQCPSINHRLHPKEEQRTWDLWGLVLRWFSLGAPGEVFGAGWAEQVGQRARGRATGCCHPFINQQLLPRSGEREAGAGGGGPKGVSGAGASQG